MRSLAWFSLIGMLIGVTACTGPEQPHPSTRSYRDLKRIFREEAAQLKQQRPSIQKIVTLNGVTDTIMVADTAAINSLFQPFMDADISKPSLYDAYSEAKIANAFNGDTSVMYMAKGKQTRPSQVILNVDKQQQLRSADITSSASNMLYRFKQDLHYEHNKLMRIITVQKVLFLKEEQMEVIVQFGQQNK